MQVFPVMNLVHPGRNLDPRCLFFQLHVLKVIVDAAESFVHDPEPPRSDAGFHPAPVAQYKQPQYPPVQPMSSSAPQLAPGSMNGAQPGFNGMQMPGHQIPPPAAQPVAHMAPQLPPGGMNGAQPAPNGMQMPVHHTPPSVPEQFVEPAKPVPVDPGAAQQWPNEPVFSGSDSDSSDLDGPQNAHLASVSQAARA